MRWFRDLRGNLLIQFARFVGPRRARVLALRFMAESGILSVTFQRLGFIWTVEQFDHLAWDMFVHGGYHLKEMAALSQWMQQNGVLRGSRNVLIDAGANIGTSCVPLIRKNACRGLAIEPVVKNFRQLEKNVASNGLSGPITLVRKAISRTPGVVRMRLTNVSGGHFVSHDVSRDGHEEIAEGEPARYEEVDADTLTGIVAGAGFGLDEIALVWADVQGCELDVIESGQPLWARGVPLWAEVEPRCLRRQGTLERFAAGAAAHFSRFLVSRDLIRLGEQAVARPIADLPGLIHGMKGEAANVDALFLPPSFETGA
jgi:FkbM family methyltransferase